MRDSLNLGFPETWTGEVFGRQRSHPIAELSSNHLVIKGGLCRCCGNHDTLELIIGDGSSRILYSPLMSVS